MEDGDVDGCVELWGAAWAALDASTGTPPNNQSDEDRERLRRRIRHLLATDPTGSLVAVDPAASPGPGHHPAAGGSGRVVGLGQAFVRDGLWVLSLLGVDPEYQDRHVGRDLLEETLEYGDRDGPGLIMSSKDHRAQRRYLQAGFALHPAAHALSAVDGAQAHALLAELGVTVRAGSEADLDHVDRIATSLRGSGYGADGHYMLGLGVVRLYVTDEGYGFFSDRGLTAIGATDERQARAICLRGLADVPTGVEATVLWLTAQQQWAFETCAALRMTLGVSGAVMVRGAPGPMTPFLPSGGFG